jgi:hypothetical protein
MSTSKDAIIQAYQSVLGRAPDAAGLAYWSNPTSGFNLDTFTQAAQKEVAGNINNTYQQVFGRPADTAGMQYWQNEVLNSSQIDTMDQLRQSLINGAHSNDRTAYLDNAQYNTAWSSLLDPNGQIVYDPNTGQWTAAKTPLPPKQQLANQFGNPLAYDQKNPYLQQMADSIKGQVTENLNRNVLPGIGSAAVATGGYGGSRQGVVEANAVKDANSSISNALTGMYFGDYNAALGRQLQQYGMDQNFYTAQRGQDLQQTGLGASIYNMGTQGMLGQGQGIYNLGLTAQQAPWQTLTGFTGASSPYTGYGSTSGTQSGSAAAGALGGALGGAQLYNAWKGSAGTPSTGANMSYAPGMQPTNVMSYF